MEISYPKKLKIFGGNSNPGLLKDIAKELGCEIGQAEVKTFSDGEISVSVKESVRGADCYIVQSTCAPVNNNLMELLILADALKRASAAQITAVIPYFGYARQDRKSKARDPITAKLVADLLSASGIDRILTIELHAPQIQGFFDIPVNLISGAPLMANYIKNIENFNPEKHVVLAPDLGSIPRARKFANLIGCQLAIIDKHRSKPNQSEVMNIIGDIKGKKIIMLDDIADTAGTLCNAAAAAIEIGGATEVYAYICHGVLSSEIAFENIKNSKIKKVIMFNTIPVSEKICDKFKIINVAPVLAEAISRINLDEPVSTILE